MIYKKSQSESLESRSHPDITQLFQTTEEEIIHHHSVSQLPSLERRGETDIFDREFSAETDVYFGKDRYKSNSTGLTSDNWRHASTKIKKKITIITLSTIMDGTVILMSDK